MQRQRLGAVARDERDLIGLDVEAGAGRGDVVGDDQIDALAVELPPRGRRSGRRSARRSRPAPDDARSPRRAPSSARMSGVRSSATRQVAALFDLRGRGTGGGRVVGDGRGHDDDVALRRARHARPRASRARCGRARARETGGGSTDVGPAIEHDLGAAACGFAASAKPIRPLDRLPMNRTGIEILERRSGGDEHAPAGQRRAAGRAGGRRPGRCRRARRAGPSRSSRTPDSPRPDRRSARRARPAARTFSLRRPRAPTCWCSSPARGAPARAWRDRARTENRRRSRWRTCR